MENNDQRSGTLFLERYVGVSLYDIDIDKRYSIYVKDIIVVKGYGYALIGNP